MLFEKTSSQQFHKFGNVTHTVNSAQINNLNKTVLSSLSKSTTQLFVFAEQIHLEITEGLALIIIRSNEEEELSKFVVHGILEINAGMRFNILPITSSVFYNIYSNNAELKLELMEKSYTYEAIIPSIKVEEILSYHYNIKSPKYVFDGEKHDYYELTYVDYGELDTQVEGFDYKLKTFNMFIYGPGQLHTQAVPETTSCSYLTIMFNLKTTNERNLLNNVFSCNKEIHDIFKQFSKLSSSEGSHTADLLVSLLNLILVKALALNYELTNENKHVSETQAQYQSELLENIIKYIGDRIYEPITIEEICRVFSISRSSLQTLFNTNLSESPKKYINNIKLTRSKQLIKENKYTISEIAFMLGYNSIHYFSRTFTKHYGLTPTNYAKQIYKS